MSTNNSKKLYDKRKKINGIDDGYFEWDNIVQEYTLPHSEIIINLDDDVNFSYHYREVYNALRHAESKDKVRIIINSYGGYVDTFLQLYHYLLKCNAETICELHAGLSCGSMLALCCDKIELSKHAYMMIHSVSYSSEGKHHEIKTRTEFEDKHIKAIFQDIYATFLNDNEIKEVIKGKDFYFNKKELEKRFKNWIPIRKR